MTLLHSLMPILLYFCASSFLILAYFSPSGQGDLFLFVGLGFVLLMTFSIDLPETRKEGDE